MANFMVKLKDGRLGKSTRKPDSTGRIHVFIQNDNDAKGIKPKFEFTKIPTKVMPSDIQVLGTID